MNKLILRRPFNRSMGLNVVVSVAIMVTCFVFPSLSKAQVVAWSTPQTIPGFDLSANPPILIADQNRVVHAFSAQRIKNDDGNTAKAIVYNQWTLYNGWTEPIDIMLSPNKEARLTDVYLDENGLFHMTFFGGDNTGADIYYTKAPAILASDSNSWSVPLIIGRNAGDPEEADFIVDDAGTYFVVYNGRQQGNGLYVVNSGDGGENWSNPIPIFFTQSDEPNIAQLEVVRSQSGWSHAIWGVFNEAGQGRGIFYARSENGLVWSEPILLADAKQDLGTQKPTIFEYNNTLLGIYLTGVQGGTIAQGGMKVVMRRSYDNGETWDGPFTMFPRHIGMNGEMSMVVDGNGELHLFFGERIPGMMPDLHGMWHSRYVNSRWLEPEAVVSGPKVTDREGLNGFDPNFARAVVSQGNIILITWKTDPSSGDNGIWYSYLEIDAPELPVATLPSQADLSETAVVVLEVSPGITPDPTEIPIPPQDNNEPFLFSDKRAGIVVSPSTSILIGIIVAIIIIVAFLFAHRLNSK